VPGQAVETRGTSTFERIIRKGRRCRMSIQRLPADPVFIVESGPHPRARPVYFVRSGYPGARPVTLVTRSSHPEAEAVFIVRFRSPGAEPVYAVGPITSPPATAGDDS